MVPYELQRLTSYRSGDAEARSYNYVWPCYVCTLAKLIGSGALELVTCGATKVIGVSSFSFAHKWHGSLFWGVSCAGFVIFLRVLLSDCVPVCPV